MAEIATVCFITIAITAAIGTGILVSDAASSLFKKRFSLGIFPFVMATYPSTQSEYKILWDILSYSEHVNSSEVVTKTFRSYPESIEIDDDSSVSDDEIEIIIDISRFKIDSIRQTYRLFTERLWLAHDVDEFGRFVIRMICPNDDIMKMFKRFIFHYEFHPSELVLLNCSSRNI